MSILRDYEQFVIDNANAKHVWNNRYNNMLLYNRWRLNATYSRDDIALHEYNTLIRSDYCTSRCNCKMCIDLYNPKGFVECNDPAYNAYLDLHGLFNDPPTIKDRVEAMHTLSNEFEVIMKDVHTIKEEIKKDAIGVPTAPTATPTATPTTNNKKIRIDCCMQ